MEAGVSTHDRRVILEPAAALGLHLFQLIQRGEHPIGQWLVGERPKPRSLLDLGRIRREEQQLDAFWKRERGTLVPPRAIQQQHHLCVGSRSHFPGKQRQGLGKHLSIHRRQEQPGGTPAFRMDKGIHLHPLIARGHRRFDRRSFWRPDPPQNGTQANAVLIHTPQFDGGLRMGGSHVLDLLGQVF